MASQEFFSSVPEPDLPHWQVAYESAVQEADSIALFKRIEIAEAAILTRRDVLAGCENTFAEQQQTEKALTKLRSLKKYILKF
jgi:hypothetical protein